VDALNNCSSSVIDKVIKNNVGKINDENLSTFDYYLEQNYIHWY